MNWKGKHKAKKKFFRNEPLVLDVDGFVLFQGKPSLVETNLFYTIHRKLQVKLGSTFYLQILKELNLDPILESNNYAEQIFRSLKQFNKIGTKISCKCYVGDYVQIAKTDLHFRKSYKLIFQSLK